MSRAPMQLISFTTRSTSEPWLAGTPFSSQRLSSSPTRTLPPGSIACAAIGICMRPREYPGTTETAGHAAGPP